MLLYVFGLAVLCFAIERIFPGWALPKVRTWPVRVIAINLVQLGVVLLAGVTWEKWLSSRSLFHLRQNVSPALGGLIAYFVATFIFYWWHRWRHRVDVLWLMFHQIHHTPQRIEVITSFYKHPLEMVVNSIIGSTLVYSVLGLGLKSGAIYTACTGWENFSTIPTYERRGGSATSFKDRKCTESITNTTSTPTTMVTSFGGTWFSARMKIPANSGNLAVSMIPKSSGWARCWRSTTSTSPSQSSALSR